MGLFNTLITDINCPNCMKYYEGNIQFKYGKTWQYEYKLGDVLKWGSPSVGFPDIPSIKAYGSLENEKCPYCGELGYYEFDVYIQNNILVSIEQMNNLEDYSATDGDYAVLTK